MGHDRQWNQNKEKYVYSKEEIQSYRVPLRIKQSPCVDTYIPLIQCLQENDYSLAKRFFDRRLQNRQIKYLNIFNRRGNCYKENEIYQNCTQHWASYEINGHVQNSFWNASDKATDQGLSQTFAGQFYKGIIFRN
ncbi:hypothetical protein IMG5_107590 [Ichthyophthirius multifiliis]|uniref:Uncharacterized protein n=1 Tax=Ichthyophthirius multifiliis TaxID=5932 RepID=G0QTA4_ICHMU|nr:hypothetical protein IMG5_107590 [Ichthyophthirius multifiliis]EGR31539.1 hypothetical protein IMG5_107590 [Ichthyophthirius multifiliis]|eukprot:XP_004035025.1 hypothetical protein IMG5_107590 [Ichthyophthirius multifiliis]